ncbi:unnamed protein product [Microthlaspi erraticum]|uniref:3-oxoacyl-[acyl-carrier-protein] reductase n=1 Tax=Microthlaspi erraticum TaxID=1685480 RepID=A0A6D2I3H4_9BRAS|nr:unnamed protein product [Microthlaspi erraticum]
MAEETPRFCRYAVVTGANRGIGLEICRQLVSKGVKVVLTSRDEKRGLEAVETLKKEIGVSDQSLVFHQLDVSDPTSITSLAEFVKTQFGKLDILLSDSPRIVNVSSSMGKLKNVLNDWAKGILSDAEKLTEERIDEVINQLLNDFKDGTVKTKNWAKFMSAYVVSKAALNGYTRIIAKKHPWFLVNSVCPGFVKTDMNHKTGVLSVEEGASSPVRLALLPPQEIPSGCFFDRKQLSEF